MKILLSFSLIVIAWACTFSKELDLPRNRPRSIELLLDDEPYSVHSLTEVGGDEFRPPYLECIEEILYGVEIKDRWQKVNIELGKCPHLAQVKGIKYQYIGYCDRFKLHVYRSELDSPTSITTATLKKSCSLQRSKN